MLGGFSRRAAAPQSRIVDVGWIVAANEAGFIWDAPRKFSREENASHHAKSVQYCPAVLDHEARLFEILCPIDAQIAYRLDPRTNEPRLVNAAGDQSAVRGTTLGKLIWLVAQKEWRHPERPMVQVATPYHFLADEQVFLTQFPPFGHYRTPALPGVMIGGRMPIDVWPRPLMWAFEWHDPKRDLLLRRGEPWFYVRFETADPSRPVRLIEAETTPELKEYLQGMSEVTNYVNRSFSLFKTAKERRPKQLLVPKKR